MAHTSYELCYTVNAFIVRKHQVLLVYHNDYDAWFGPGGHIEKDEDVESAAYREIKEETGLLKKDLRIVVPPKTRINGNIFGDMDGEILKTPYFVDIHRVSDKRRHLAFRYIFETNKKDVISKDSDIVKLKWFDKSELDGLKNKLRKHVYWYANFALHLFER